MLTRYLRSFSSFAKCAQSFSAKEEKVKIGKYDINFLKLGTGPHNVILTPGALGTIWTNYKMQINGFDKEKFTLVSWDPPGYGKSYPPEREINRHNYENDADLAYQLMKYLKIPKYSSMGWSAGGTANLILAAKYPDAVNKLVVWGANTDFLPEELETYKEIRDLNTWNQDMRDTMIKVYGEKTLADYWRKWVDSMYSDLKVNPDVCWDETKNITCSTFILHGAKDPLMHKSHVTELSKRIRNSRTYIYPEGKHDIHVQYAEDFNKRVQEFLLAE